MWTNFHDIFVFFLFFQFFAIFCWNENIVIVKGYLCKNITNFSCMVFDKFVKQEMTKKSSIWCDSNSVELSRFISQFDFFSPKSKYMSKTCLDTRLRKIIEFFLQMVVNLVNQNSTVTPLLQDEWIFFVHRHCFAFTGL